MKTVIFNRKNLLFAAYTIITTTLLATGSAFSNINRFIAGLSLISIAVMLYFIIVLFVADKNWLDIRAVFHGSWCATIGLAALRLTNYQEEWQPKTWICLALAYLMFQIGAHIGLAVGEPLFDKFKLAGKIINSHKISFELHENRFFWICITTTLIGFACFVCNVAIKGYIPCFSEDPNAYLNFYTRFQIFSVASTGVAGLCYYCIVTQNLSKLKKIILACCILYVTFLYPILIVSRGTFMASAIALMTVVFYVHKKKFWVMVTSLVLIAGIYAGASMLRSYTDAQLKVFFEPADIQLEATTAPHVEESTTQQIQEETTILPTDEPTNQQQEETTVIPTEETTTVEQVETTQTDVSEITTTPAEPEPPKVFTLPPKLAFIYGYLTVSHDNFNEAVQNSKEPSYGIHQISPFNTIFRSEFISQKISESEYFLVRPHLNTVNLIGYFYYDFHTAGVVILMLLWAFAFALMQAFTKKSKTPFFLLALGNAIIPVALCFFSAWLSVFSQWLLWGVVLLFIIASCFTIKKKAKNTK